MREPFGSIRPVLLCGAFVALACAAISDPSYPMFMLLLYVEQGLLLLAVFRARYDRGKSAAWWFGFAALGWSHFAFSTYSRHPLYWGLLFKSKSSIVVMDIDLFIAKHAAPFLSGRPEEMVEVVSYLMTLGAAVVGGYVSVAFFNRANETGVSRPAPIDESSSAALTPLQRSPATHTRAHPNS